MCLFCLTKNWWIESRRTGKKNSLEFEPGLVCVFPKIMVPPPQIIHFNRVFHYKPSILGYPYFWKHPFLSGGNQVCVVVGFGVIQCGREEFLLQRDVVGLMCSILFFAFVSLFHWLHISYENSVEFYCNMYIFTPQTQNLDQLLKCTCGVGSNLKTSFGQESWVDFSTRKLHGASLSFGSSHVFSVFFKMCQTYPHRKFGSKPAMIHSFFYGGKTRAVANTRTCHHWRWDDGGMRCMGFACFWSNYSNLTRPHLLLKCWFSN